ncbi:2-hydroxymuconate tautomerase family protein [Hydrogenophaga sp.]|uniref:2-hydroxymuconate tautomerase family protein n=1 Tax=Hydrogenophaga sp. TaxID=1904254 RepID=UPI0035672C2A
MPVLLVKILQGRPPEKIEALIAALTEATARSLDAPPESVRVLVEEMPKTHWGVGGQSFQQRAKQ